MHCVIYLTNNWSLELHMQHVYQLIHEDYLTCAKMGRWLIGPLAKKKRNKKS